MGSSLDEALFVSFLSEFSGDLPTFQSTSQPFLTAGVFFVSPGNT